MELSELFTGAVQCAPNLAEHIHDWIYRRTVLIKRYCQMRYIAVFDGADLVSALDRIAVFVFFKNNTAYEIETSVLSSNEYTFDITVFL